METMKSIKETTKKHANDTGSTAVQIVQLTERIQELTDHCKRNQKDHSAKRGMVKMVSQRKKSLEYLQRVDNQEYVSLLEKLNLRK